MSRLRHIIVGAVLAVGMGAASAQNITESVTVEGKYTPDIIPADRLALLPAPVTLIAPESPMAYDRKAVIANFAPDALNLPATGWRAKKAYDTSKGYLDLCLGSWLNSSLSAGFNAINSQETQLNVYLQHNSTSLWQAWQADPAVNTPAADKRFRYDETIGADFRKNVYNAGTLHAGLQYHLGHFNYYGTNHGTEVDGHFNAPTQTLNDLYANVEWTGAALGRLIYSANADVRHFGYRAMYLPSIDGFAKTNGNRETVVNVGGNVKYALSDDAGNGSSIGADLLYSGVINSIGANVNRVQVIPAYTLTERNYTLRLGANLAIVGDAEKTRFRIAPDVNFSTRKGISAFSASLGGGTDMRTLAWMHSMDYYANPGYGCYQAAYSPLDIRLAFQLNPGGRWTLGIEGDWRTTLDESFGGLYQALLNGDLNSYGKYPENGKIHGFRIVANAAYEFSRFFGVDGKIAWQPQEGSKGYLNGFDRPAFTADFSVKSRPMDRLSISLDYRLRAKRQLGLSRISRLDLSADYRITDKISVGAELDNLLNRHDEILPALPLEGLNAAAFFQIAF